MAPPSTRTIALDDPAYQHATTTLCTVHDDLAQQRRALGQVVDALLDGGWAGPAATQFGEGWTDWERGCGQVLEGLVRMADLMTVVRVDLHVTDAARSDELGRLRGRMDGPSDGRSGAAS